MYLNRTLFIIISRIKQLLAVISVALLFNHLTLLQVEAIRFNLETNSKRCLKEEMRKDVLVSGEYQLTESPGQRTDLQITDSKGHHALNRENVDKGKFAVTSDEDDIYDICFISYLNHGHSPQPREVTLELKHGVEAKNYDEVTFCLSHVYDYHETS